MLMLAQPRLSRVEWQAVAIALRDAEAAPAAGLLHRLGRLLTGGRAPRPLADSRLEAIRAFVCETRRRGVAPASLAAALERTGFSTMQVAALALLAR